MAWADGDGEAQNNRPVIVYISGSGRSGSTLIERALGAIPGFVNVGELIDLFRRTAPLDERCGCGQPFSACPFWSAVGQQAFGGWNVDHLARTAELHSRFVRQRRLPAIAFRQRLSPRFAADLEEYRSTFRALYRAVAQVAGARVVVDASKWPAQALCLATDRHLDVRILHLVRDAHGVAYSWGKQNVPRPQAGQADKRTMATASVATATAKWVIAQGESSLAGRLARSRATVRYEDFTEAPGETLAQALRSLALAPTAGWLDHIDGQTMSLPASHGLSGNPSRFQVGDVTVQRDDEWRTQMSTPDRRLVTAMASAPLIAYGYLRRQRSKRTSTPPVASPPLVAAAFPPVTVVLPTRGRPELVRRSLAAVMAQNYPGEIECILVHDQELADATLATYGRPDRPVRVVTNTHKPGLAGARNTGLQLADRPIIASCDDDDVWFPDKLRKQVELLVTNPDLLVVGSGIRLIMPRGRIVEWRGRADRIPPEMLLRNRVKELHSSTLVMWRDAFAKAGTYDEDLPFGYGEDYDWVLRVSRVGRIGVVREPLADISKDVQSWFRERAANTALALELMLEKHPELKTSRRGHARILGQIAFAKASLGQRRAAVVLALRALLLWPLAPHALLALAQAGLGLDPRVVLDLARKAGRGLS